MKSLNKKVNLVAVLQIILGVLFLFNMASDIQLGFGLVLLTLGLKDVFNT